MTLALGGVVLQGKQGGQGEQSCFKNLMLDSQKLQSPAFKTEHVFNLEM